MVRASLSEFNVIRNAPAATQIQSISPPKERTIVYTYSGENGTGVATAHNFAPGTQYKKTIEQFNSFRSSLICGTQMAYTRSCGDWEISAFLFPGGGYSQISL